MYNEALILLEDKCLNINNNKLNQVGLESPNRPGIDTPDRDIQRERNYNPIELQAFLAARIPLLQTDQRTAYNGIMEAVANESGGLYFIDAPGGTRKPFLISLILAKIRVKNIALAIATLRHFWMEV